MAVKKAAKKTAKRAKTSAKTRRVPTKQIPRLSVAKVMITWVTKAGKYKTMDVDLKNSFGFMWKYDKGNSHVGDIVNPTGEHLPYNSVTTVRLSRRPRTFPDPIGCWWNGSYWVCPDELDQDDP